MELLGLLWNYFEKPGSISTFPKTSILLNSVLLGKDFLFSEGEYKFYKLFIICNLGGSEAGFLTDPPLIFSSTLEFNETLLLFDFGIVVWVYLNWF